jgi:hypothetical protein
MSKINSCVYINKSAVDTVNFSREIVYLFNKTLYIVLFVCVYLCKHRKKVKTVKFMIESSNMKGT